MSSEKKWFYYKHTKPCFATINGQECVSNPCNYAHSLEQYLKAIAKHKFKVDSSVVIQFERLNEELVPSNKKRCIR
jgi:hypothetical protein